MQIPPYFFHFY